MTVRQAVRSAHRAGAAARHRRQISGVTAPARGSAANHLAQRPTLLVDSRLVRAIAFARGPARRSGDQAERGLGVGEHPFIREPEDEQVAGAKHSLAVVVTLSLLVGDARVHLNHEGGRMAVEVDDEAVHNLLMEEVTATAFST